MSITIAMRTQVSQLYVSLFGRAPDAEGLGFWASALADGMTMARLAQEMYNTAPARDYYPTAATNREIVATFYLNVLGREADAGGLDFWTREMDVAATKGDVFAKLLNNVVNYTGSDAAGLKSQALFLNKVAVAQYYGENEGDIVNAADVLVGVTDKYATVIEAKAAIDAGVVIGVQTYEIENVAAVLEGEAVVFDIKTTGVAPGTDIVYSVTGTGNALLSTQIGLTTVNADGTAKITVNTLENSVLNDQGLLSLKLMSGTRVLAAADDVAVLNNDIGKTYNILNVSSVTEGASITYNIVTTGVATGTQLDFVVTGAGLGSQAAQIGSVLINGEGKGSVTINTISNQSFEADGTLNFVLKNGAETLATANLVTVVNDDVLDYEVDASSKDGDTSVEEGDSVTFNISTTGLPTGTELSYMVTGTGNGSGVSEIGSVVINALGKASVTINTKDNLSDQDNGTLTFVLKNGAALLASKTVTVLDNDAETRYSVTSTVNVEPSEDIIEGATVTYTIDTDNIAPGTEIAYVVTGTGNAFESNKNGFATINADGKATVEIRTYQNTVYGDEGKLSFKLLVSPTLAPKVDDIIIGDDEGEPVNSSVISVESAEIFANKYLNDAANINEGDIIEFTVKTEGYAVGSKLYYSITGEEGSNVDGISKFGTFEIGTNGVGKVQIQTDQNKLWEDAGDLTFRLGDDLEGEGWTRTVGNDDDKIVDNTYYLTTEEDDLAEGGTGQVDKDGNPVLNEGDDSFYGSVGGLSATFNEEDDIDGGAGYNTLTIKIDGDQAVFPELNPDGVAAILNIQHIIIDRTDDHDLEEYWANPAIWNYYFDLTYFDTDPDETLERFTILATEDKSTSLYEDIYIHRDGIVLEYIGAGEYDNSQELWEEIYVGEDVTELKIELDGVGGDEDSGGYESYLEFSGYSGFSIGSDNKLETIEITGSLAGVSGSGLVDHWSELNSFDAQLDLEVDWSDEGTFVNLNKLVVSLEGSGQITSLELEDDLVEYLSEIDLSESTVSLVVDIDGEDLEKLNDDGGVVVKLGSGDDIIKYQIGTYGSPSGGDFSIDLSTGGNDLVIISNDANDELGNLFITDSDSSISDLTEDLIVITGYRTGDRIKLDLEGVGEDGLISFDLSSDTTPNGVEDPVNFFYEKTFAGMDFYDAVNDVAEELISNINNTEVVGVFEFNDELYIYADTDREVDTTPLTGYDNEGLSSGDVLIKLVGVEWADLATDWLVYSEYNSIT